MDVRKLCRFAAARIDDNEFKSASLGLLYRLDGVLQREVKVESETSGLVPTSRSTSANANGSRPAAQLPKRPAVTHLADWSMVIVEKNEREPIDASQAGSIALARALE